MSENALVENIKGIPPVTRFYTISSVLVCLAISTFDALPSLYISYNEIEFGLSLIYQSIRKGGYLFALKTVGHLLLNSYKFLTSVLIPSGIVGPNKFNALLDIYFFYTFSNHLEADGKFKGNFPDFLWFNILCSTCIYIFSFIYNIFQPQLFFPHEILLACITYVWSRANKNAKINLIGLVPIKAYYLPLGNLLVKMILGGPTALIDTLMGIITGYLYLCVQSQTIPFYNLLQEVKHQRVGQNNEIIGDSIYDKGYLKAPKWLYEILKTPYTPPPTQSKIEIKQQPSNVNYWFGESAFKGKGYRLGD
ncbi:unnamed protein product [Candida verbasci]|uniref:Derlin n=1 Tax=Candida verbasci TaxID=1227364 RepID=A0A9W4XJS1_9ASCO|nr:unnamed protein product [Candida verbasci]